MVDKFGFSPEEARKDPPIEVKIQSQAKPSQWSMVDTIFNNFPGVEFRKDCFTKELFILNYSIQGNRLVYSQGSKLILTQDMLNLMLVSIARNPRSNRELKTKPQLLRFFISGLSTAFDSLIERCIELEEKYLKSPGDYISIFLDMFEFEGDQERLKRLIRKWFYASVRSFFSSNREDIRDKYQAFEPKQNEIVWICRGKQGLGKSRIQEALTKIFKRVFTGFDTRQPDCYDNKEAMTSYAFILLDEIGFFSQKATNTLKWITSTNHIEFRRKYEAGNESHLKRCCFLGSTNKASLINDGSGSRRYLITSATFIDGKADFEKPGFIDFLEFVWGQAVYEIRQNPLLGLLQAEDEDFIEENNKDYSVESFLTQAFMNYVIPFEESCQDEEIRFFASFSEIAKFISEQFGVGFPTDSFKQKLAIAEIREIISKEEFFKYKKRTSVRIQGRTLTRYKLRLRRRIVSESMKQGEKDYQKQENLFQNSIKEFFTLFH
jgi:hypothetical protein